MATNVEKYIILEGVNMAKQQKFNKMVVRSIKSLSRSGTCQAIAGIITGVLLAWTSVDIYNLQKRVRTLEVELEKQKEK